MTGSIISKPFRDIVLDKYDAVLIDLDNTIYSYEPCHLSGLRGAFEVSNLGLEFSHFSRLYRSARNDVTRRLSAQGACRSRLFAFQAMAETLGISRPYLAALALDQAYWSSFLSRMEPDPEGLAFLRRAKLSLCRVAIVTDMTAAVQIEKLVRLGLVDLVDHLVTSEEVGHEKPHPTMFEVALRKVGTEPQASIMVGDDVEKDIRGALALGIDAALVELRGGMA